MNLYKENVMILLIGVFLRNSFSFSSGSVGVACKSMTPIHVPFGPQDYSPPFIVSATTNPRGLIDVTISGDQTFSGFFIHALEASSHKRVGQFVQIPQNAQYIDCDYQQASVAHDGSGKKRKIIMEWDPSGFKGLVKFRATIVQSYSTFWTEIDATYTIQ